VLKTEICVTHPQCVNNRIGETQLSSPLKGSGTDTVPDFYGIIIMSVAARGSADG